MTFVNFSSSTNNQKLFFPKNWMNKTIGEGLKGKNNLNLRLGEVGQVKISPTNFVRPIHLKRLIAENKSVVNQNSSPKNRESIIWQAGQSIEIGSDYSAKKQSVVSPVEQQSNISSEELLSKTPISLNVEASSSIDRVIQSGQFIPTPATLSIASRRKAQWQKYQRSGSYFGEKIGLRTLMRWSMFGIMILSFITMASVLVPELYFRLNPETINQVATLSKDEIKDQHLQDGNSTDSSTTLIESEVFPEPEFDPTLPLGNWIKIPSIGVDTQLDPSENPDEALAKGAWLVPDFGRPNDTSLPIIAAAHRFGWDWWWLSDFGKKNSFYSLPKLKAGDEVQIVFNQRLYRYNVYAIEEGYEITDYNAHLILYTCKYLNSPDRYFVYADRKIDESAVGEKNTSKLSVSAQ